MEVGPTAHYSMGGVVVDIKCRTKIRGLHLLQKGRNRDGIV